MMYFVIGFFVVVLIMVAWGWADAMIHKWKIDRLPRATDVCPTCGYDQWSSYGPAVCPTCATKVFVDRFIMRCPGCCCEVTAYGPSVCSGCGSGLWVGTAAVFFPEAASFLAMMDRLTPLSNEEES